jgi:hypothetical protein
MCFDCEQRRQAKQAECLKACLLRFAPSLLVRGLRSYLARSAVSSGGEQVGAAVVSGWSAVGVV